MSSIFAADRISVIREPSLTPARAAAMLGAGAVAAGLTAWSAAESTVLVAPDAAATLRTAVVVAYTVGGVFTLWRGQTGRFGYLLVLLGLFYALTSLVASADADVHSAGRLLNAAFVGLYVFVFLAFPSGRLGSRFERVIVGVYVAGAALLWPVVALTAARLPAGGVLTDCGSNCPGNGFQVWDVSPRAPEAAVAVITAGVAFAAVYVLARRAWSPIGLERRTVAPILLAGIVVILSYVVFSAHPVSGHWRDVNLVVAGTAALFAPIAFVLAPLNGELYVSRGMWRGLSRIDYAQLEPGQVESVCRSALGDRSLRLAVAVPGGALRDVHDQPIELPFGPDSVTEISRPEGSCAVVHDLTLGRAYRPVVERVGALAFTLVDYTRAVRELVLSRRRIAERDSEERRSLERDLHDGAQQRLLAIQMKLAGLGGSLRGTDLEAAVADVSGDAASAVEELRRLAHGIYPPLLLERGLGDALREQSVPPSILVRVADNGVGRAAPAVERALYFATLEAMQNATKHAGASTLTVTLEPLGDLVEVTVADDGAGFDAQASHNGTGLTGIRDRIGSVGGEVEIASGPGGGTVVRYLVPRQPDGEP